MSISKNNPNSREPEELARLFMNRRRFLRGMVTAGAGLLAACAAGGNPQNQAAYRTATPFRALPSPLAPQGQAAPTEATIQGSIDLEEFMQFSSLLTGVDNLDPNLGRIYLQALQSGGGEGPSLADVYGMASSDSGPLPADIETLGSAGFFDQEGAGSLADQIITMWYTGTYQLNGEDQVATFVDALAWKVLRFTKPPTICAQFGFWSTEPQAQISPTIQYTPVPTQPAEAGGEGE